MTSTISPQINTQIFTWAIARIGITMNEVLIKYPKFLEWKTGKTLATINQLKDFSNHYHFPFAYFFLENIPDNERKEILFFRNVKNTSLFENENVNETVRILKNRQEWLSDYLKENGALQNEIIGLYKEENDCNKVITGIRKYLNLEKEDILRFKTPTEAIARLTQILEEKNIIITFNSVVNNNGHRHIPIELCRGFCLIDDYTPFIFINSRDSKTAQLFSIIHELAHVFISFTAGFGEHGAQALDNPREAFCDEIAANFLVPKDILLSKLELTDGELAKMFNVSKIVILRRKLDCGYISKEEFLKAYNELPKFEKTSKSGGNFYRTAKLRIGNKLLKCVNNALKERIITPMEAYRLSGVRGDTFTKLVNGSF